MKKDKIISKTEDLVYLILSILAILFIIIETVDLFYVFYKEVSRFSFSSERPLGLSLIHESYLDKMLNFTSHEF
jgi:hypothetical protein